jgi:hypothetical protein
MHNDEDQSKMLSTSLFTTQGAWIGFVSYIILAGIIATVFIVG